MTIYTNNREVIAAAITTADNQDTYIKRYGAVCSAEEALAIWQFNSDVETLTDEQAENFKAAYDERLLDSMSSMSATARYYGVAS